MRITIGIRVFLALTVVVLTVLALNAAVTQWNFQRGFLDYVTRQETEIVNSAAAELAELYLADGNWAGVRSNPRLLGRLLRADVETEGEPRTPRAGPGPRAPRPPDPLELRRRVTLLDADGMPVAGPPPTSGALRTAVDADGRTVGFLSVAPRLELSSQLDRNFAREQQRSIVLIAIAALVFAAIMSAILARQLTRPIRALASGARSIRAGDYAARIDPLRRDELGDLARDFNRLAETLDDNRAARKRWIADIAHELRTPLAVLRGELDAIEDGVRTFDAGTRKSLQAEVRRLNKLVADLHDLSVYDDGKLDYELSEVDVCALLGRVLQGAEARLKSAGIELDRELPRLPIDVFADEQRLEQVFGNLLENTLRYTDFPGRLRVSCGTTADSAVIEFADSSPGVPERALARVFDRLFRVEASRSREYGGSGLGLAICKAIVTAHGGSIEAKNSSMGGLLIVLRLPLAKEAGA
ncbi:MAG: ATP-binding protein [Pseudomonadota bacterium]